MQYNIVIFVLANDLLPIFHLQQNCKYQIQNFLTKLIQSNTARLVQMLPQTHAHPILSLNI